MPILKVKKNGLWEEIAGTSGHTHTISDIINLPASMPADGGNADTVGGKSADAFADAASFEKFKTDTNSALEGKQPKGDYALKSEIPAVPVQSVNGKTGAVELTPTDIGAQPAGDYALKSEIVQADFNETDETSKAFIKNKPTRDDALQLAVEMELIDPITDENGAIYTDLNGEILSL